ncbi:hypothetical protein VINI7043_24902 [Vibrio nigripulchritudo ATCC 27043]|nr:hypothetical protein VINI7043_24902 [Vibrio nigripulchritudo ATCC 27043]
MSNHDVTPSTEVFVVDGSLVKGVTDEILIGFSLFCLLFNRLASVHFFS